MVVDDHAAFAESLREVLGRRPGLELTASAPTGEEAVRIADEVRPDVILMDQRLPGTSGAQTTAQILARLPSTKVVMLTGGGTDDEMLDAVEAGVSGYLIKTARVADIVDAIRRVAAGEMLISAETLRALLQRARERARTGADRARRAGSLTPRELDVLRLMAAAKERQRSRRSWASARTPRGGMSRRSSRSWTRIPGWKRSSAPRSSGYWSRTG